MDSLVDFKIKIVNCRNRSIVLCCTQVVALLCNNLIVPSLHYWHCKNDLIYTSYHELPDVSCLRPKNLAGMLYVMRAFSPPRVKVYLFLLKTWS